jgi:maleamate amidohydrolase
VEATRRLLDAARGKGLLAVFTTIAYEPHLVDAGVWIRKMPGLGELVIGSEWVELDDRLGRRENEPLLPKKGASAFFGTNLASILTAERIDTVLLCGATTSGCIRATAVDLCQYGFPTLVPRECVGDRAREPHDANLFDIDAKYADVVSLDDALDYVDRLT